MPIILVIIAVVLVGITTLVKETHAWSVKQQDRNSTHAVQEM
jgi:hypothetical protein